MNRFFLPMSRFEMDKWGWDDLDVIFVTGDAFIDHPFFPVAIMARLLKRKGYRVGIVAQPNALRDMEFAHLGKPRLFFAVTSGNSDSMAANYSAEKKKRKYDNYTPGRIIGKRSDRATAVYSQTLRRLYPDVPIVVFGIEATMRRLVHFDYWDSEIKKSLLADSGADMLIYGTGENQIQEIADRLAGGENVSSLTDVRGTVWKLPVDRGDDLKAIVGSDYVHMPNFEQIYIDREAYLEAFKMHYFQIDPYHSKPLVQEHPTDYIIQNPPQMPLKPEELDDIYTLDYIRTPHPRYKRAGAIPIFETIKFSLTTHRGCFAGCSFCSVPIFQGPYIQSRTEESILSEADMVTGFHYFRGWISNIGGPTGNMWKMQACGKPFDNEHYSCCYPNICEGLTADHAPYIDLIRKVQELPAVDKVYVATGIRYDILMRDPRGRELLEMLVRELSSHNFKFAPEHVAENACKRIRKYQPKETEEFMVALTETLQKANLSNLNLVPYFIAGHPGSGYNEAIEVAHFMKRWNIAQNKVHDFVPMPMTAATCMYYTGIDPYNNEKVYRPLAYRERKLQRALLNFYKPQNQRYVYEALQEANRTELIGDGQQCLLAEEPEVFKY